MYRFVSVSHIGSVVYVSDALVCGVGDRSLTQCQCQRCLLVRLSVFHSIVTYSALFIPLMADLAESRGSPGTGTGIQADVPGNPNANSADSGIPRTFPDPISSPKEFTGFVSSLANPDLTQIWQHLQKRPVRVPGTNRLVDDAVSNWSDRMDGLVVSSIQYVFYQYSTHIIWCRAALAA